MTKLKTRLRSEGFSPILNGMSQSLFFSILMICFRFLRRDNSEYCNPTNLAPYSWVNYPRFAFFKGFVFRKVKIEPPSDPPERLNVSDQVIQDDNDNLINSHSCESVDPDNCRNCVYTSVLKVPKVCVPANVVTGYVSFAFQLNKK